MCATLVGIDFWDRSKLDLPHSDAERAQWDPQKGRGPAWQTDGDDVNLRLTHIPLINSRIPHVLVFLNMHGKLLSSHAL